MEKTVKVKLGYCPDCKKYDELISMEDIEATPGAINFPRTRGLFFEDEISYHKTKDRSLSGLYPLIHKKAFEHCDSNADGCKYGGSDGCAFHYYGFNWSGDTYFLINCDCESISENYKSYLNLQTSKDPPCIRDECFYDFSDVEVNHIQEVVLYNPPKNFIDKEEISELDIIPKILGANTFIHVMTYNIDEYFLGIFQALAVKGVNIVIILNQGTLTNKKLKRLLSIDTFSHGNIEILLNKKVHAKRIFIDGVYDLDLSSRNLSYSAFYEKTENIANLTYAHPKEHEQLWNSIKELHDVMYLGDYNDSEYIFDYCESKKTDILNEWHEEYVKKIKGIEIIKRRKKVARARN